MGVFRALKKGFFWGFSPKRWIGVEHVNSQGKVCSDLAKDLLADRRPQPGSQLSHSTNEMPLAKRKQLALLLIAVYLLCLLGFVGYAWFLAFFKGFFLSAVVSFGIACLFAAYALRELLLLAQLSLRKNRVTFKDLGQFILQGFRR